jgi:hypothetical protein
MPTQRRPLLPAFSLLLSVVAVAVMLLPTYVTVFGAEGGGHGVTHHGWYDPFLLVYLDLVPMASLISGIAMTGGLALGLAHGRVAGWVAVPGLVAALLLLVFGYNTNAVGFVTGAGQFVAPILAVASALAAVTWLRRRREE